MIFTLTAFAGGAVNAEEAKTLYTLTLKTMVKQRILLKFIRSSQVI